MSKLSGHTAVLLMALGGPDSLANVEPYLLDLRGGRPTSPELIAEIRHRYEATGGRSPVLAIMREVASLLERTLNEGDGTCYRVAIGMRHWHPYIKDAYADVMQEPPAQLLCVCMAPQYSNLSVGAYVQKVQDAHATMGGSFPISYVKSWHRHPKLIEAIAARIQAARTKFPADVRDAVPIVFTAHSLPERILAMNDPYPDEVHGTVEAVCERLHPAAWRFAYQSQGKSGEKWLGPTVEATIDELYREGYRHLLIAPIGFLSDHLEVLYDVDIEFKLLAQSKGMQLERMAMLNASPEFIAILAAVLKEHQATFVA